MPDALPRELPTPRDGPLWEDIPMDTTQFGSPTGDRLVEARVSDEADTPGYVPKYLPSNFADDNHFCRSDLNRNDDNHIREEADLPRYVTCIPAQR